MVLRSYWLRQASSILFDNAEHQHRTIDLDALLVHVNLQIELGVLDEGAELRFVVEDVVVSMLFDDPGVVSRNRGVVDSDLALVAPPHPYSLRRDVLDADHGRVLNLDFLEDQMLSFGELDRHQFEHLLPLLDKLRVLLLTDFTEEFLEVVVGQSLHLVLLDLCLIPLLQAREVHQRARSRTLARTAQELILGLPLLHHAVLAFSLLFGVGDQERLMTVHDLVDHHNLLMDVGLGGFVVGADRGHEVLFLADLEEASLI